MTHYPIELRTRKYVKGYGFFSFARNLSNKYEKKIIRYCYENRTRGSKNCFLKSSQ